MTSVRLPAMRRVAERPRSQTRWTFENSYGSPMSSVMDRSPIYRVDEPCFAEEVGDVRGVATETNQVAGDEGS
jgi:hypothetical protein